MSKIWGTCHLLIVLGIIRSGGSASIKTISKLIGNTFNDRQEHLFDVLSAMSDLTKNTHDAISITKKGNAMTLVINPVPFRRQLAAIASHSENIACSLEAIIESYATKDTFVSPEETEIEEEDETDEDEEDVEELADETEKGNLVGGTEDTTTDPYFAERSEYFPSELSPQELAVNDTPEAGGYTADELRMMGAGDYVVEHRNDDEPPNDPLPPSRDGGGHTIFEEILMKGHDEDFRPGNFTTDDDPTDAAPGSHEKLELIRKRVNDGKPLWHPRDRVDYKG